MSSSASRPRPRDPGQRRARTRSAPGGPAQAPAAPTPRPRRAGRARLLVPGLGLGLALTLLGAAGAAALQDPGARAGATRAATSAARTGIEQMLSYDHSTIDAQAATAESLLTGPFKEEFAAAMEQDIKPLAVKNRTVVQARVSDIGVMRAEEGRVTVLAFVNQATVQAAGKQPAVDQNRVIATLSQVRGRWLISDVQAF